jgi:hypothetical protein
MRRLLISLALGASALAAGCAGTTGTVAYTADVSYRSPSLAYVSPGVYAVADYNEPVFYSNNSYWLYRNNNWYRSNYYDRGWTYYRTPPRAVLSINSPRAYVRYRPADRYRVDRGRVYRSQGGVEVRDHRRGTYYR